MGNLQLHAVLAVDVWMFNSAWHVTLLLPYALTIPFFSDIPEGVSSLQ